MDQGERIMTAVKKEKGRFKIGEETTRLVDGLAQGR